MEDKSKKSSMVADSQRRSVQTCDSVNLKWLEGVALVAFIHFAEDLPNSNPQENCYHSVMTFMHVGFSKQVIVCWIDTV